MFNDESLVISSDKTPEDTKISASERNTPPFNKKIFLYLLLGIAILAFIFIIIIIVRNQKTKILPVVVPVDEIEGSIINTGNLPNTEGDNTQNNASSTLLTQTAVEYLAFTDFYDKPNNNFTVNLINYTLPINIKIDGINYYDLSRRLSLDASIDSLNNNGFAILPNPWQKDANNFYDVYKKLEQQQIPLLITSDFLIYYHQNMMKKVFKEIEEHVFYQNLWIINKELYEIAKNRYEANLAISGNINEAVLEGQRMELAFLAVTLELLKPAANQIAVKGAIEDKTKFNEGDVERFSLNLPAYIREDVLKEVSLIRSAKETVKSPNLLYVKNYSTFTVPKDYKLDAKLNNFYLAAKWINSVFPSYYISEDCPQCLLDQEDWRISMVASSLLVQDFSSRPDLKTRWARIYKLISFFQGLREEIDYVNYRDSLVQVFGENYNISELFSDRNPESFTNLEKLQNQLLSKDYPSIRGAYNKEDLSLRPLIGFKMLSDFYWPNDYIFSSVSWPIVDRYEGAESRPITACTYKGVSVRCGGFSYDIVNLTYPLKGNKIFDANAAYIGYEKASNNLSQEVKKDGFWHTSNYWSTLILMESLLHSPLNDKPVFMTSDVWQQKNIETAAAAWVNLQLPLENITAAPIFNNTGFSELGGFNENVYIEPNLPLVNELLATTNMLAQMFTALRLNEEINLASQRIQAIDNDLKIIKQIIEKELTNTPLDLKDKEAITEFSRKYMVDQIRDEKDKILYINASKINFSLRQDLNYLRLLAVVHESNGNKIISVGPIWDHREIR